MTTSIGSAIGLLTQRSAVSGFATSDPGAGPRDFEREFERAIVDTWFAGGPIARLDPAPTRGPDGSGRAAGPNRVGPQDPSPPSPGRDVVARSLPDAAATASEPGAPTDAHTATLAVFAERSPATACGGVASVTAMSRSVAVVGPRNAPVDPAHATVASLPPPTVARTIPPPAIGLQAPPASSPLGSSATDVDPPAASRPVPAEDATRAAPAPPIRLHVEAEPGGEVSVWLGVDAAVRAAGGAVVEQVRDTLLRSGLRVRSVVVNGETVERPAARPSIQPPWGA